MPPIMTWTRIFLCAAAFICTLSAAAQTPVAAVPTAPITDVSTVTPAVTAVKDRAALVAVTALAAATGWQPTLLPQDVLITGTVTRHISPTGDASASANDPTATFTIKLRGRDAANSNVQFSYAEAGTTFVTSGPVGAITRADGKVVRLPAHSAAGAMGMIFPAMSAISDFAGPDVEIVPLGTKTINDDDCVGVRVQHKYADADTVGKIKALVAPIELWISKASGTLTRADYLRVAADNHYATLKESAYFYDYRAVSGVAVPFRQEIFLDDNHIKTLQFNSVTFNAGASAADFDVKAILAGAR